MKKIIFSVLVFVLMGAFVFAQGQGIHDAGTGLVDSELKESGQGTGQGLDDSVLGAELRIIAGEYNLGEGKMLRIQESSENRIRIQSGDSFAECQASCELREEKVGNQSKLIAKLSNGKDSEVKVMPDSASETALARLRLKVCSEERNCSIELKEVGQGEQIRLAYELQTERESKVFGLFKAKMQVRAQVDAESGEVIRVEKPWWAFLAFEPEEA